MLQIVQAFEQGLICLEGTLFPQVGGSPGYTMTEDYALGMELKKEGYHCRYVREYLALGMSPWLQIFSQWRASATILPDEGSLTQPYCAYRRS